MNLLDLGVALIVAFVTVRGFFRGFFRELFGIFGWLAGGVGAALYYTVPAPWISERWTLPPAIGEALGGLGVFVAIWLTTKLLGWIFDRLTEKSLREPLDRSAGTLFGFVKALVMCAFILLIFTLRRGAPEISFRIPDSFCGTWLVAQANLAIEIGRTILPAPEVVAAAATEGVEAIAPEVTPSEEAVPTPTVEPAI